MERDIIDRLNDFARGLLEPDAELVRNAADEIDRLREPERKKKAEDILSKIASHGNILDELENIVAAYRDKHDDANLARVKFIHRRTDEDDVRGRMDALEKSKQATFALVREIMEFNP